MIIKLDFKYIGTYLYERLTFILISLQVIMWELKFFYQLYHSYKAEKQLPCIKVNTSENYF